MRCSREDIVFFSCILEGVAAPDAKADPGKDSSPEAETSDPGIGLIIGEEAPEGMEEEEIEDDCCIVGNDRSSRCDVVFSDVALEDRACSGGSIIVIDVEEGGEGGEWKSEWWRLTSFSALDEKNQWDVFSG